MHRTSISEEKEEFALQILRNQLGCWVNPCHRIDRKTSGVLVFAKSKEADAEMGKLFQGIQNQKSKQEVMSTERQGGMPPCQNNQAKIQKKYLALVRGFIPESGTCNRPLENEKGKIQEAITHFKCLQKIELEIAVSRYPTSRYSLSEITPETGRMHQIRRHFAQMRHYIIGDKTHGECKHNKMFEEYFGLNTMLLHASEIEFIHPFSNEKIHIIAKINVEFENIISKLKLFQV